jgi:hypothetical protein
LCISGRPKLAARFDGKTHADRKVGDSSNDLTKLNDQTNEPSSNPTKEELGDNSPLAHDLLWGSQAIADELGLTRRKVFYYLETGTIPARKLGQLWVGSRRQLRVHLLGEAA